MVCNLDAILLFTSLHPQLGADEVSGESWQLITAIHNEGDSLTLCVQHLQGYDHTLFFHFS